MSCANEAPPPLGAVGSFAAVALSAAVCALAFAPFTWVPVLWVALVPALWAIEGSRPGRAVLLGLVHGTLYAAGISNWLVPTVRDYFEQSALFTLGFQLLFWLATVGIYHGALFGVLSLLRRLLPRTVWLLLVPLAFAAADLARTSLGLRSPWARIGDAYYECERLRQLAGVTGVYGLTALVVLGNVLAAEALRFVSGLRRGGVRRPAAPLCGLAALFFLLLGGALVYGQQRLDTLAEVSGQSTESLDVAVVQGSVESSLRWKRVNASRVLRRYSRLTRELLREGEAPDLVVWPEQALQTAPDDAIYGPPLRGFVDHIDTPILLGAPRHEWETGASRVYNAAFLMRPGLPPIHYDKRMLLPFSETWPLGLGGPRGDLAVPRYAAGERAGILRWEGPALGVLICFEAVYAEMARVLARGEARVLVNIANDGWLRGRGGPEQHLAQVVFRAVETGLPIVRASTTGVSAIIGPGGGIVRRIETDRPAVLAAGIEMAPHRPPPYLRSGDAFAFGCAGAVLLSLVAGLRRGDPAKRKLHHE